MRPARGKRREQPVRTQPVRTNEPMPMNPAGAKALEHRASVASAASRMDAGEVVPTCGCGCELDRLPVAHSVRCPE